MENIREQISSPFRHRYQSENQVLTNLVSFVLLEGRKMAKKILSFSCLILVLLSGACMTQNIINEDPGDIPVKETGEEPGETPHHESPSDLSGFFSDELQRAGVERVGMPIEGFSAFIYLEAFPGFEESDFDGVQSLEGIYKLEGDKLEYVRTAGDLVTSAEETISEEGYVTLLENFSMRVGIEIESEEDIAALLEKLREGDVYPDSFIYDDFSIWLPEGWYPYEFEYSVLFVHDPDLEFPGATEGYALAPWIQVGLQEIDIETMFEQNLWTEGSEALVSMNDVMIGNDQRIRVVTNAAGAGGQLLNYVFDAGDGRVFTVSIYPYEAGSQDTDDFERAVQSFMINYVFDGSN